MTHTHTHTDAGGSELMGDLDRVKAIGGSGVDLTIGSALDIFGILIRVYVVQPATSTSFV